MSSTSLRVVVTGAASGIGRAVATQLRAGALIPGAHKVLLVDRDEANLKAAGADLGPSAAIAVVDLLDPACGERIVDAAITHMGGIDAVVSNAGAISGGALSDLSVADFDRTFAINTRSHWLLAKAAYPHLKQSRGTFLATASISGTQPTPALAFYSSSKAALLMLIRQMSIEWGPDGIRCNSVSPGPTYTPMTAAGYADEARRAQREANIPLHKLGTAEEVANAILFLISPAASHINGVDLLVDGGMNNMVMPATGAGAGQASKD